MMIIKIMLLSVGGLMLLGCNDVMSNKKPLPEVDKPLTQDGLREILNHSLRELETLSADTPIVFDGMGKQYKLAAQDVTLIKKELIRAIQEALRQSPIVTFDGYAPFASLPDGYLHIGDMVFYNDNKIKNDPFLIYHGAVLELKRDYFIKMAPRITGPRSR